MVNIIENSSVVATVVGSDAVQRKAFGLVLWQWVGLEASMAICRLGIIEGVVLGCTNRNSNSDQQQGPSGSASRASWFYWQQPVAAVAVLVEVALAAWFCKITHGNTQRHDSKEGS